VELLDAVEVRVLGSLLEKEIATPEYYPLTTNALVNACNQKSNRDPVLSYDEGTVEDALDCLRAKKLAATVTGAGIRVPKHRQLFSEALNLGRRELAVLCVLMLRGPQTTGEIRERAGRLHEFSDTEAVENCLERLMDRQPDPLVARLPRQPGTKEPRYAHLLAGAIQMEQPQQTVAEMPRPREDRLAALELEVKLLRREFEQIREQFASFRRQFE
jgi:uncharacterized protein